MTSINRKKSYKCILVFTNMLDKVDFELLTYSYAKLLKQLGAKNLTATGKTNYALSYPINKTTDVKFVELSFSIQPQALQTYQQRLRIDESILRFFLTVVE
jgi:ribosomal protein S6